MKKNKIQFRDLENSDINYGLKEGIIYEAN